MTQRPLIVCLDPGHGAPGDPGCVFGDFREADYVFQTAEEIKACAPGGLQCFLSRRADEDPTLGERAKRAQKGEADIVLSLHCNASYSPPRPPTHDPPEVAEYFGEINEEPEIPIHAREHGSLVFRHLGTPGTIALGEAILTKLHALGHEPGEYIDDAGELHPMRSQLHTVSPISAPWKHRAYRVLAPHGTICALLWEIEYASHETSRIWLLSDAGRKQIVEAALFGFERARDALYL